MWLAWLVECVVLGALFAAGAALERSRGGISLVYVGLALLYAGPMFRRLLAARGRVSATPRWARLAELAAFTGLVVRPVGLWAHGLLTIVALHLVATPPEGVSEDERASTLEEALVVVTALAAAALTLLANGLHAALGLTPFLPLAIEAWSPRAPRTLAAASRRVAAFSVAGSAAVMLGADWRPGARADELVFAVGLVLAALAALEVVSRVTAGSPTARVDEILARVADAGTGRLAPLGWLLVVAVIGAVLLGTRSICIRATRAVEPTTIEPAGGLAFYAPGVNARPDGLSHDSTLEVTEDGRLLGPGHGYPGSIERFGHGRFRHDPRYITFSSSDGSDPRTNGRRYVLRYDWTLHEVVLGLILVGATLLNARRLAALAGRIERMHPAALAAGVLVVALAFRVQVALQDAELTYGMLVKGVPFSDARDWYSIAVDFSRNDRSAAMWYWCSARRPFHWALLGAVFALTEPSLLVARVFNVVLSALTAVFIFDAVRRVSSRPVALLAALTQALMLYDARMDLSVMTEPVGNFFGAIAVWGFVLGTELAARGGARLRGAALAFLGGGVALGLSNLARPLTLAAAAGLPLVVALVARRIDVSWRRLVAGAAFYGAGAALAVAPWMIRQRIVHGIWTISENTAEVWFAATSPEHGTWGAGAAQLAGDRSIRDRVAFYMEGASRNLSQHFVWYVKHVIEQLGVTIRFTGPPAWLIVAACAWYVATALATPERAGARRGLACAVALVTMVLVLAPAPPLYAASLLGLTLAFALRQPSAILGGYLVTTLVSVSMVAMAFERRLTHSVEWVTAAFAAAFVLGLLRWVETRTIAPAELGDQGAWGRAGRVLGGVSAAVVVLVLVGFARALTAERPTHAPVSLPAEPYVSRALEADRESAFASLRGRLVARRARVRPGFEMKFGANELTPHWCPKFDARPYPFTIFETEPEIPDLHAVYPGVVPPEAARAELILVGVPVPRPEFGTTIELVALGVCPAPGAEPRSWLVPSGALALEHGRYVARQPAK